MLTPSSLHGKAWSSFGRPVEITTQDSCLFYDNQAVYHNFGGIVSLHSSTPLKR